MLRGEAGEQPVISLIVINILFNNNNSYYIFQINSNKGFQRSWWTSEARLVHHRIGRRGV